MKNSQNLLVFQQVFIVLEVKISDSESNSSWKKVKNIVDKVHKHVCGHASLSDIQILLERNNMWNSEVRKYLSRSKTYEPKQTRKVSVSSLNRYFNDLVCIDHFHLGDQRICHIISASKRCLCDSTMWMS